MVPGHATAFTIYKGLPVSAKYEYITIYDSSNVEIRDLTNEVFTDLVNEIVIKVPEDVFLIAGNSSSTRNMYLKLTDERVDLIEPGETKRYPVPKDEPISATFDYCDFYWDAECTNFKAGILTSHVMTENWGWTLNPDHADYFIWNYTSGTISIVYKPIAGTGVYTDDTERVLVSEYGVGRTVAGLYEADLSDAVSELKIYAGDYETDPTSCFLLDVIDTSDIYLDGNKTKNYNYQNVAVVSCTDGTGNGSCNVQYWAGSDPDPVGKLVNEDGIPFISGEVANAGDALSTIYDDIGAYDVNDPSTEYMNLSSKTITGMTSIVVEIPQPGPEPEPEPGE